MKKKETNGGVQKESHHFSADGTIGFKLDINETEFSISFQTSDANNLVAMTMIEKLMDNFIAYQENTTKKKFSKIEFQWIKQTRLLMRQHASSLSREIYQDMLQQKLRKTES